MSNPGGGRAKQANEHSHGKQSTHNRMLFKLVTRHAESAHAENEKEEADKDRPSKQVFYRVKASYPIDGL